MPSTANAGSKPTCVPAADSASTRWIAVSCACRRAQNARGNGAGRNVQQVMSSRASRRAATSDEHPFLNHPTISPSPGGSARVKPFAGADASASATYDVAQRWTPPWWPSRSRTVQPGQVGTAASRPARSAASARAAPLAAIASMCVVTSTAATMSRPPDNRDDATGRADEEQAAGDRRRGEPGHLADVDATPDLAAARVERDEPAGVLVEGEDDVTDDDRRTRHAGCPPRPTEVVPGDVDAPYAVAAREIDGVPGGRGATEAGTTVDLVELAADAAEVRREQVDGPAFARDH